jgi:hypothetical protein
MYIPALHLGYVVFLFYFFVYRYHYLIRLAHFGLFLLGAAVGL